MRLVALGLLQQAPRSRLTGVDLVSSSTTVGCPLGDMKAFDEGISAELEKSCGADATVAGRKPPKEGAMRSRCRPIAGW